MSSASCSTSPLDMVRFTRVVEPSTGAPAYALCGEDGAPTTLAEGCPYAGTLQDTGRSVPTGATRLAPVEPTNIICIGLNYKGHADELKLPYPKNPVVFNKPATSATGHGAKVAKPRITEKMDYEVELAVVIGKACKDVSLDEALDYVLGYTVANDLSTRDWQKAPELAGGQWSRSKSFDGFAPLGPVLVTREHVKDPNNLWLRSSVNGEKRQDSRTSDFIFRVQEVISFLSCGCTLAPGTVILTGTPAGVAEGMPGQPWLKPGDTCITEIEGLGSLHVEIVADPSTARCYMNLPSKI